MSFKKGILKDTLFLRMEEKMPEVSVIMAVYNKPGSLTVLSEAIDSILHQSFKDLELILCDDGSTDETVPFLEELKKRDERIRVIQNKVNQGAAHARNQGILVSKGKYIAIMDSDDISRKTRLEKQYTYLEKHPEISYVGCKGEFFVEKPGDDGECYWFCEKPVARDFLFTLPYVHASIMARKEAFEKTGGYDQSKRVLRCEDYDLLLRMEGNGLQGANLDEVLYDIRRDKNQYKRRKYRYRIKEARMRFRNYRKLGLMPIGIVYAVKPLLVGLLPWKVLAIVQKRHYKKYQKG